MTIPEGYHRHKNGGGLVANTAQVADTVFIGHDAEICGDAVIHDNARVYGNAMIGGDAWIYGNAKVYDDAVVTGNATISGHAIVRGEAKVTGNARVCDSAIIGVNAQIFGDAVICGGSWIGGDAEIGGDIVIYDEIIETSELWAVYDSFDEIWVNKNNMAFEYIIGYEWNTIKNMFGKNLFGIPLMKSIPDFSGGIKL